MHRFAGVFVIFLTIGLQAQTEAGREPKKPPTPKEKAREIVDKAVETVAGHNRRYR